MASAAKRKRDVALSPLIEKAVKQARSAQPAREDTSRVVAPGTMIEAPLYMRMAPTPSKSASPVKNAEGDESEDELLIEQASRRKVTRPSPKRLPARSQPVASTSEIPYTPPQWKRKLESEDHGTRFSPAPPPQSSAQAQNESSKGKGKAFPRVKQEADDIAPNPDEAEPASRAARPQPSPTSPQHPRMQVTVEIPVKRQLQSSKQVPSTSRKKANQLPVAPTPASMKRPKIEEPDEDVLFVRKADATRKLASRQGVGEPPPVVVEQQQGAVVRFLAHQCDPPIPQDRVQDMVDLFKRLGISTEYELKAIAKPGNVQDFWMGVAKKEGLSTLWEAVIRDGLGKLV